MNHRLHVLVSEGLDAAIREAAHREGISRAEWVRRAIQAALRRESGIGGADRDPLIVRGGSAPRARSRDFSSDQGAEPEEYREYAEVWQRRDGGAALEAPTADIDRMIDEIDAGR